MKQNKAGIYGVFAIILLCYFFIGFFEEKSIGEVIYDGFLPLVLGCFFLLLSILNEKERKEIMPYKKFHK